MGEVIRLDRADFLKILPDIGCDAQFCIVVTGTSMTPFLLHGCSRVYLKKQKNYRFKRGDILLFKRKDGRVVLHRVYKAKNGVITMNGDAQTWTESIAPTDVLAQAVRIQRKNRIISADSYFYRVLVILWRWLMPIRLALLRLLGGISKIRSSLCGKRSSL